MSVWNLISTVEENLTSAASVTWPETSPRFLEIRKNAAAEGASLSEEEGNSPFARMDQKDIKRDIYPVLDEYGKMLPGLYKGLSWYPVNRVLASEGGKASANSMDFTREWPLPFGPKHSPDKRGSLEYSFGWFKKPITFMDTHPYPKSYAEDILRTEIKATRLILYTPDWRRKKMIRKWDNNLTFEQSLAYEPETIRFGSEREFYTRRMRTAEELAQYDAAASELLTVTKSIEIFLEEYRRSISGWDLSDAFMRILGMRPAMQPGPAGRGPGIRYNRFWLSRR